MTEFIGSVSTKGQVTLPQEIRRKLGINPGDKVRISIEEERVILRPAEISLLASYMSIPPLKKPLSDEEMDQAIEDAVVDEYLEKERRSR
jgi:AbrB family looped-hinge helix DNA binding protein